MFLGSGLLFLAMLFAAGAISAGVIASYRADPVPLMGSGVYIFARAMVCQIVNVYALKMVGVFMISNSTIALRTGIFPRWMAFLGFVLAALLLLSTGTYLYWTPLVFPLWVLLVSAYILFTKITGNAAAA